MIDQLPDCPDLLAAALADNAKLAAANAELLKALKDARDFIERLAEENWWISTDAVAPFNAILAKHAPRDGG